MTELNQPQQAATAISRRKWLPRILRTENDEIGPALWAAVYNFCLMCSYFILKPIRDEMGIVSGIENLQYLFTATFAVMLLIIPVFGWISTHYSREKFLPYVYIFFIVDLLTFYALFKTNIPHVQVARVFYVWVNVFNLFVVSVFWSFMSEIFSSDQAKRLFSFIATGGTLGGIIGPTLTSTLVTVFGPENLLLVSAMFLGIALLSISRLHIWHERRDAGKSPDHGQTSPVDQRMQGGMLAGVKLVVTSPYLLGICLMILLYSALSTFLYFQELTIVDAAFDEPAKRTAIFGMIELLANGLTMLLHIFATRNIVRRFAIAPILASVPFILCFGFLALWWSQLLAVVIAVQVIRRAGNYAITRPMREMLYVVLSRAEKYKAKNLIDTAVYRAGDMASAWVYSGLSIGLGLSLSTIALIAAPISGVWACVAYQLGKMQEKLAAKQSLN